MKITTEYIEDIAQKLSNMHRKGYSIYHARTEIPFEKFVKNAMSNMESHALIDYVNSLDAWDEDYSRAAIEILAERAGIDIDSYDDPDDLWEDITAYI